MSDLAELYIKVDSTGVATATKNLSDLNLQSAATETSTVKATSSISKLTTAVAALAASYLSLKTARSLYNVAMEAARYETLSVVMRVVGNNAQYTGDQMEEAAKKMQKMGISMLESRNATIQLVTAKLQLADAERFASVARDAAVVGGIDTTQAMLRIIRAVKTGEVETLKTIGINVRFEDGYRTLAKQMGKTTAALTNTERTQARANMVFADGASRLGAYEAAMDTAGKQVLSFKRHTDNLRVILGQAFTPAMSEIIQTLTKDLTDLSGNLSEDGSSAIKDWGANFRLALIDVEIGLMNIAMMIDRIGGTFTQIKALFQLGGRFGDAEDKAALQKTLDQNKMYEERYFQTFKNIQELKVKAATLEKQMTEEYKAAAKAASDAIEQQRIAQSKLIADKELARQKLKNDELARQAMAKAQIQELREIEAKYRDVDQALKEYRFGMFGMLDDASDKIHVLADAQARLDDKEFIDAVTKLWNDEKLAEIERVTTATESLVDTMREGALAGRVFGDSISSSINNAVISMRDLTKVYEGIFAAEQLRSNLNDTESENYIKNQEDRLAATKELAEFEKNNVGNQLTAYRQLFGTTSQLFKENSKERKAMSAIEQSLAAIEIALNLKKAISSAVAAVAAQGTVPVAGFAMAASMATLMAGVLSQAGVSFSGGSSSGVTPTYNEGTGTVLGDTSAASESINNVSDTLMDIHESEYPELQRIKQEMIELNNNITGLVSSILRGTGDFTDFGKSTDRIGTEVSNVLNTMISTLSLGILKEFPLSDTIGSLVSSVFGGKTKTSTIGSGFELGNVNIGDLIQGGGIDIGGFIDTERKRSGGLFSSSKTSYETLYREVDEDVERLFESVFVNMSTSLIELGNSLGIASESIEGFVFSAGRINLLGLTGDEINQRLEEVFSAAMDSAVDSLFKGIEQYQQVGEGLFETATRLVIDKVIILDALEGINLGFEGIANSMEGVEFSQSILKYAEDLDSLSSSINEYFKSFFSEEEQFDRSTSTLVSSLENLNYNLPETREGFRTLVESLQDAVNGTGESAESARRALVTLLSLSGAADSYYDTVEQNARDEEELRQKEEDLAREALEEEERLNREAEEALAAHVEKVENLTSSLYSSIQDLTLDEWELRILAVKNQFISFVDQIDELGEGYEHLYDSTYEWLELSLKGIEDLYLETLKSEALSEAQSNLSILQTLQSELENSATSAKQDYISALNNEINSLKEVQDTLESVFTSAKSLYQSAIQSKIAELTENQRTLEESAATAKENYINAIKEEISALGGVVESTRDVAEEWSKLSDSLKETIDSLNTGSSSALGIEEKRSMLKAQFESSIQAGFSGDLEGASKAGPLASQFLELMKQTTGDRFEYAKIFKEVQTKLESIQGVAANRGLTPEEETAQNSGKTVEELQRLLDSLLPPTLSMTQAADAYYETDLKLSESNLVSQVSVLETELSKISDPVKTLKELSEDYYIAKSDLDNSTYNLQIDEYEKELNRFIVKVDLDTSRNRHLETQTALMRASHDSSIIYWEGIITALSGNTSEISDRANIAYTNALSEEPTESSDMKVLLETIIEIISSGQFVNTEILDVLDRATAGQNSLQTRAAA